jgi:hypothetical protein
VTKQKSRFIFRIAQKSEAELMRLIRFKIMKSNKATTNVVEGVYLFFSLDLCSFLVSIAVN